MEAAEATVRPSVIDARIHSLAEEKAREKKFAEESHYYNIMLKHDPTGETVKVRVPAIRIDENGRILLNKDGKPDRLDPHEVARRVWAVMGADEYDVETVFLGSTPVATGQTLAIHLAVIHSARTAERAAGSAA